MGSDTILLASDYGQERYERLLLYIWLWGGPKLRQEALKKLKDSVDQNIFI